MAEQKHAGRSGEDILIYVIVLAVVLFLTGALAVLFQQAAQG